MDELSDKPKYEAPAWMRSYCVICDTFGEHDAERHARMAEMYFRPTEKLLRHQLRCCGGNCVCANG